MARADFKLLHRMRPRFVEIDRQGIVHNSIYLVYFGVALNEYFRSIGYDQIKEGDDAGTGIHVVSANIQYKAPLRFDTEFDIGARVGRLGRTSLTFEFEVHTVSPDLLVATGNQVWVNTNRVEHKAVPWPGHLVSLITANEGERLQRS